MPNFKYDELIDMYAAAKGVKPICIISKEPSYKQLVRSIYKLLTGSSINGSTFTRRHLFDMLQSLQIDLPQSTSTAKLQDEFYLAMIEDTGNDSSESESDSSDSDSDSSNSDSSSSSSSSDDEDFIELPRRRRPRLQMRRPFVISPRIIERKPEHTAKQAFLRACTFVWLRMGKHELKSQVQRERFIKSVVALLPSKIIRVLWTVPINFSGPDLKRWTINAIINRRLRVPKLRDSESGDVIYPGNIYS